MAAVFADETDFTLFIAKTATPMSDIQSSYNVPRPFSVSEAGIPFGWPKSMWLARRYARIIRTSDNDTVWYIRDVLLAFWLTYFCKKFRNRFFFELHTLTRFPPIMYGRIIRYAKGIITTNEKKKQDLIERYHIPGGKILVFGNGIDLEEINALPSQNEARSLLGLPKDKKIIVYAGTDAEEYGTNILREVEKKLSENIMICLVVGKQRNEALHYMAAADILIAPYASMSDHFRLYMSPMKVKEYMALGKPIIVSNLPSIKTFLPDDAALFVPPGDVAALRSVIQYSIDNFEKAEKKGLRARELAQAFTWDKRAHAIISFMEKNI